MPVTFTAVLADLSPVLTNFNEDSSNADVLSECVDSLRRSEQQVGRFVREHERPGWRLRFLKCPGSLIFDNVQT